MFNYKIASSGFRFQTENITSGQFTPYASLYLGKEADAPQLDISKDMKKISEQPCQTFLGSGSCHTYQCTDETGEHILAVRYKIINHSVEYAAVILEMTYTNLSQQPVYLQRFGFKHKEEEVLVCSGNPHEWILGYKASLGERLRSQNEITREIWEDGYQMPCPPLPDDEVHNDGRWRLFYGKKGEFLPLYAKGLERGLFLAPVGEPVAFLGHECFVDINEQGEGSIKQNTYCDMSNVCVLPGQSRASQQMMLAVAPYDYIFREVLQHLGQTHGNRTTKGAAVGWCSWYYINDKVTEEYVIKVVDAIAANKDRIPMPVIQIDDGFQRTVGNWEVNEKFPNGWGPIIEKIEAAGSVPGIWLAPAAVHKNAPVFSKHPDWIMRDVNGEYAGSANNWGPTSYWLDFSHPEAYTFAMDIVRKERESGFQYFKIDFNEIQADGRSGYGADKTSLELYRHVYKGYREMIGDESYLCSCSAFTRGTFGYADSSRIGPDSLPGWKALHPCTLSACLQYVGYSAHANDIIYANDPDVTYLDASSATKEELQTWHSMVGLLGGVQMVSDPMWEDSRINALRMFEILNPPAKEKGLPLYPATDPDNKRFGFLAHRPYGDFASIMVYNPMDETAEISTALKQPEQIGESFHVWSFWDQSYLGVMGSDFPLELAPHSCKVMRFTPVNGKRGMSEESAEPVLIGSDLHISMGAAEVTDVLYGKDFVEITLDPNAGSRDGALYLYSKKQPIDCRFEGCKNVICSKEGDTIKLSISGREWNGKQSVRVFYRE